MADLDANRSASYLTAVSTADNAAQLGDPDPAALVHDGETDSSHKSVWQQLKGTPDALQLAWNSTPGLLFQAILFYLDFVSDVLYAILLRESPDLVGPSNVVISVLVLPPLALSAMDLYEYYSLPEWVFHGEAYHSNRVPNPQRAALMGWKGVALNLTNTRML